MMRVQQKCCDELVENLVSNSSTSKIYKKSTTTFYIYVQDDLDVELMSLYAIIFFKKKIVF